MKNSNYGELKIVEYNLDPLKWIVLREKDLAVLCESVKKFPYIVYFPIKWTNYQACEEWVKTGSIGEIQEDFSNLNIGFVKSFVEEI
jgi:hypothetical protein